jgi:hypothetical protein
MFESALNVRTAERRAFLEVASERELALANEVERMLDADTCFPEFSICVSCGDSLERVSDVSAGDVRLRSSSGRLEVRLTRDRGCNVLASSHAALIARDGGLDLCRQIHRPVNASDFGSRSHPGWKTSRSSSR